MTEMFTPYTDERGHQHEPCALCGVDCSTHPDAGNPLASCGDCGRATCPDHRVDDAAARCNDCAAHHYATPVVKRALKYGRSAKRNTFTKHGGSTYPCDVCGRRTRNTGVQTFGSKTCPQCYEIAGIENGISDGHETQEEAQPRLDALTAEIVKLGGRL